MGDRRELFQSGKCDALLVGQIALGQDIELPLVGLPVVGPRADFGMPREKIARRRGESSTVRPGFHNSCFGAILNDGLLASPS